MITVSSREFRSKQKSYLDQVAGGEDLLVTRKNDVFRVIRVSKDDALMSKDDFIRQLENAATEIRQGKSYAMKSDESLDTFMDRMIAEGYD